MAATLEYIFEQRGLLNDLKISKFTGGGVTNAWYNHYTSTDLFDDAPTVNDCIYFYMSAPFDGWEAVNLTTAIVADAHVLAYEYWNGSAWVAVSGLTDGTNQLTQNGQITWTMPTDWETVLANTGVGSKAGYYAIFALRVRLVSFTNFTEGGYLTAYQNARQKYIKINDGGSHTPASLYADDIANGWGVITKQNDYSYNFSCGMHFGLGTFTFNNVRLKFGETESWNYVPFYVYGCIMKCNTSATYLSSIYSSSMLIFSKGATGTISFSPHVDSEFYNLYLAKPHDGHTGRMRWSSYGSGNLVKWYNVLFGSYGYTGGSAQYTKINFQELAYLLSSGNTIYDNCNMDYFSKDPGYAPVVTRPTLDGGATDASDWVGGYSPQSISRQHHLDVISGKWTKGNKWKCYVDDSYPTITTLSHISIYSQFLNLKIQDKDGNALSGVALTLTDNYGNNGLWEDLSVYATVDPTSATDTNMVVNDASSLSVDDILLFWGEKMRITNKVGNTLTIERGIENSARVYNLRDLFVPLRRRVSSMTINESVEEIYTLERVYYKYSLDGGTTSTGNLYTDYNDYEITLTKSGYVDYKSIIKLDTEKALEISLKKIYIKDFNIIRD